MMAREMDSRMHRERSHRVVSSHLPMQEQVVEVAAEGRVTAT